MTERIWEIIASLQLKMMGTALWEKSTAADEIAKGQLNFLYNRNTDSLHQRYCAYHTLDSVI